MNTRIKDKIREIESYLEELENFLPSRFEDYKEDHKLKAACERYFEKIVEAVVDLAFLLIKDMNFETPESDKSSFDILFKNTIISKEICEKLKDAKGMRNIIAHEYGTIDDETVFHVVSEELGKDVRKFIGDIKKVKDG